MSQVFKESIIDNTIKSIDDAHLFSDGSVVANVVNVGKTPWGGGVVKMNFEGDVEWIYNNRRVHHDLSVSDDGNIYTLTHDFMDPPVILKGKAPKSILSDYVTVLNSEGKEIKTVSVLDALVNSPYKYILNDLGIYNKNKSWDLFHSNTISYVTDAMAKSTGYLKKGQVLVNSRDMDLLMAIDLEKKEVSWLTTGPWHYSHEPTLLPESGNFLIFDNKGKWPFSRVIEFDPLTEEVVWEYKGTGSKPLRSEFMGRVQPLQNGNMLITETEGGRLFEVTPDKEIVWEYSNPERLRKGDTELTWHIRFGYKVDPTKLEFWGHKLTQNPVSKRP